MKKLIFIVFLLIMGSLSVMAESNSVLRFFNNQQEMNTWINSLEAKALAVLPDDDFEKLPDWIKNLTEQKIKDIYFYGNEKINGLPEGLRRFLRISVQDLIDYNRLPKIQKIGPCGLFNLSSKNLTSLEGLHKVPGIEKVTRLYLSDNKLTELTSEVFDSLRALHALNLSQNELIRLPKTIFRNLKSLQELYLTHNKLTYLSRDVFRNLNRLRHVTLNKNKLSSKRVQYLKDLFQRRNIAFLLDDKHESAIAVSSSTS